jgi:hypothetical protein
LLSRWPSRHRSEPAAACVASPRCPLFPPQARSVGVGACSLDATVLTGTCERGTAGTRCCMATGNTCTTLVTHLPWPSLGAVARTTAKHARAHEGSRRTPSLALMLPRSHVSQPRNTQHRETDEHGTKHAAGHTTYQCLGEAHHHSAGAATARALKASTSMHAAGPTAAQRSTAGCCWPPANHSALLHRRFLCFLPGLQQ